MYHYSQLSDANQLLLNLLAAASTPVVSAPDATVIKDVTEENAHLRAFNPTNQFAVVDTLDNMPDHLDTPLPNLGLRVFIDETQGKIFTMSTDSRFAIMPTKADSKDFDVDELNNLPLSKMLVLLDRLETSQPFADYPVVQGLDHNAFIGSVFYSPKLKAMVTTDSGAAAIYPDVGPSEGQYNEVHRMLSQLNKLSTLNDVNFPDEPHTVYASDALDPVTIHSTRGRWFDKHAVISDVLNAASKPYPPVFFTPNLHHPAFNHLKAYL